jgi:hypothetical protein
MTNTRHLALLADGSSDRALLPIQLEADCREAVARWHASGA